jgi:DNA-directed RNA polymerase specialized sigma24 family protein
MDRNALAGEVYDRALTYATESARGRDDLAEVLRDAATDAIMRALDRFQVGAGDWQSYAMAAVRRGVQHAKRLAAKRRARRPLVAGLGDDDPPDRRTTAEGGRVPMSADLRDLPTELRDTVRFYFIDRYSLIDTGLLMGCHHEEVRIRLRRAAEMLRGGATRGDGNRLQR